MNPCLALTFHASSKRISVVNISTWHYTNEDEQTKLGNTTQNEFFPMRHPTTTQNEGHSIRVPRKQDRKL